MKYKVQGRPIKTDRGLMMQSSADSIEFNADCNGKVDYDCDDCYGNGNRLCSNCKGKGSAVCSQCGGTGKITGDATIGQSFICAPCVGNGRIECPTTESCTCDKGTVHCTKCVGGKVDCPDC